MKKRSFIFFIGGSSGHHEPAWGIAPFFCAGMGLSPKKARSIIRCDRKNGARCRVRTCIASVEHQGVASSDSQIDSQKLRQTSELIEVIRAWAELPTPL